MIITALLGTMLTTQAQTKEDLEDYDFVVNTYEKNYAAFPTIMDHDYSKEYKKMKTTLRKQLSEGEIALNRAIEEYGYWFFSKFDRHCQISTDITSEYREKLNESIIKEMVKDSVAQYDYLQFLECKVDTDTYYIRIPSCMGDNPTSEWVDSSIQHYSVSGCRNLIFDFRSNKGGNDGLWAPYATLIADHKTESVDKSLFRKTPDNMKFWESRIDENSSDHAKNFLVRCKSSKDEFILWYNTSDAYNSYYSPDKYSVKPEKVALMIDFATASAGEGFVQFAKNCSNKTKVYGKTKTFGAEATGNEMYLPLPHHKEYQIGYPVCVDQSFIDSKLTGTPGIAPDIIVPIPYPRHHTINDTNTIDEWVTWVANDMKKQ